MKKEFEYGVVHDYIYNAIIIFKKFDNNGDPTDMYMHAVNSTHIVRKIGYFTSKNGSIDEGMKHAKANAELFRIGIVQQFHTPEQTGNELNVIDKIIIGALSLAGIAAIIAYVRLWYFNG